MYLHYAICNLQINADVWKVYFAKDERRSVGWTQTVRRRENRVKSDRNTCVRGPSSTRFFEGCWSRGKESNILWIYTDIYDFCDFFYFDFARIILLHGDMFEESILERENIEDIYDKKGGYYNVNYNWITELFEKIEERW